MKWKVWFLLFAIPLLGAEKSEKRFTRSGFGVEFFGSALYWQAKMGGTEYAYNLASKAFGFKKGKLESQDFDWDFGYRAGAGIRLPLIQWEIVGTYIHFDTEDKKGRGITLPSIFRPSEKTNSSYKICYDNVILELRRSSFFGQLFGLRTSLGLKKVWIDQGGKDLLEVRDRCYFRALGPRLGLNLKWNLFWGLGIFVDTAASLLYGEFEAEHKENQFDLKGDTHLFAPSLHLYLGLNWDFPMRWTQLSLSLGYEVEYLWRQNKTIRIKDIFGGNNNFHFQLSRHADDLTFYGLTLRAGIEF